MPDRGRIHYDMVGVASLLARSEFRVPIYQRSYAWTADTVAEYWHDLKYALDSDDPDYFLGTVVLTPASDERRLTVIDGQQRLATTSLLLVAIRDVWAERDEDEQADDIQKSYLSTWDRRSKQNLPRLILNEQDDPFFRARFIDNSDEDPDRESHERMDDAYDELRDALEKDLEDHGRRAEARLLKWNEFIDERSTGRGRAADGCARRCITSSGSGSTIT